MNNGIIVALFISPTAGAPMQPVDQVMAIAGSGLEGDRYCTGAGSYSKGKIGNRQVTLINAKFFRDSGFTFAESRRGVVTDGVELMWLIGREFPIGAARMRGLKYCDPCERPNSLSGNPKSFREAFMDCGGLVAEVIEGGLLKINDAIVPPPRGY